MAEIVDLIKNGENFRLKDLLKDNPSLAGCNTSEGISVLQFAAYCRNFGAVEIIKEHLEHLSIHEAACVGDVETILRQLDNTPSLINSLSADGFTLLGLSSFFGHKTIVEVLLQKGADPNIASNNAYKVTPLHSACAVSNYEIADLLIKRGADVNARQMNGVTPLHSAAHNGSTGLVHILLQNGADISPEMEKGNTPLMLAQEKGFQDIVVLLKTNGAV